LLRKFLSVKIAFDASQLDSLTIASLIGKIRSANLATHQLLSVNLACRINFILGGLLV